MTGLIQSFKIFLHKLQFLTISYSDENVKNMTGLIQNFKIFHPKVYFFNHSLFR